MIKDTNDSQKGQVLSDKSSTGKERPWKSRKKESLEIAGSLKRLGYDGLSNSINNCGSYLKFIECSRDGYKKLISARFCKIRMCSMCSWRKSLVQAFNVRNVCHHALEKQSVRFIHLELTIKNCPGEDLSKTIDELFDGWDRLNKLQDVKNVVEGYFRSLEVTYNPDRNDYHPHFHVIIAVSPSYFKGQNYIKFEKWQALWKQSMRLSYNPNVNVGVVKSKRKGEDSLDSAITENTKYITKFGNFILDDKDKQDKIIEVIYRATKNRRLYKYGGLLEKIRKELKKEKKIKDVEKSDLIQTDNESEIIDSKKCQCPVCQGNLSEVLYSWIDGNYRKKEITEKFEREI